MKRIFTLFLVGVLFSGCSNSEGHQKKITKLEKEIAEIHAQLEEKEMEFEKVSHSPEEEETGEFIQLSKDQIPRLWVDVDAQLWDYFTYDTRSEKTALNKGVTNWREWDGEYEQAFGNANQTWDAPGVLMNAWMLDVELSSGLGIDVWEINTRIYFSDEDEAEGYFMSFVMRDDSVGGSDIKLTMLKENNFWYVEKVEVRDRCSRGVSEDKDLCL
ncbi:hypothetical protein [Bacillus sp. CHD6a]|uniref:hypothetical protein n=1 Tax=Bacillus sp. CHD6a TaxID=1643452 RepID=UPI0006CCB13F|nr:hypothetical protein [Bacillus sp. CHD6a]KPB04671.1 hypothetical protein AAV98_10125 [Bacillus sp. CHD6a]